jgi:RHS repeat-associated protein
MAMHRHLLRDNVPLRLHALSMRWVLMLFVILAAVMGGEARAVVVTGRAVVSERDGRAEMVAKGVEALLVESERASRGADEAVGLVDAGPLALWFPGGSAVARSDCGDRLAVFSGGTSAAEYTVTAAAGSAWTVPSAATVLHVRGPDLGGGTKGLRYSLRNGLPTFNRYNGRGDVVAQSDIDGTTTWAASYQADGRRTSEAGTNIERHRACTKEQDPTGLLNEGFRYRDMETGTFISRDPLGFVDGPNVYCYVRQNPWTHWDPEGLALEKAEREALEKDYEQAASRYKAIGGKPSTVDMVKRDHHAPDSPDDWSYRFNFTHPWDSVQEKYGSNYSIDDAALAYATEQTKSWTQVKQAQLGDKGSQRAVALRVYGVALDLVADTTQLVAGPEAVVSSLAKSAGRAVVGVSANVPELLAGSASPGSFAAKSGSGLKTVTSWAEEGIIPDLSPGRWVQLGKPTKWNFFKTGLGGAKGDFTKKFPFFKTEPSNVPFSNSVTGELPASSLKWPPGWEKVKGILGQRQIKK